VVRVHADRDEAVFRFSYRINAGNNPHRYEYLLLLRQKTNPEPQMIRRSTGPGWLAKRTMSASTRRVFTFLHNILGCTTFPIRSSCSTPIYIYFASRNHVLVESAATARSNPTTAAPDLGVQERPVPVNRLPLWAVVGSCMDPCASALRRAATPPPA